MATTMLDPANLKPTDHYTIISADCHAGASHEMYREYLDPEYLDDFDAWRNKYKNPFQDLRDNDGRVRNWDDERRNGDQERRRRRRRGRVPEHRAAVLPELRALRAARRRPTSTSTGSPASAPTTAGSSTGAASSRSGAPASARSSSTTSTTRSTTSRWIKEHGLRGGVLISDDPARRRLGEAALRPGLRPAVGGVRGPRRRRSTATAAPARPNYGKYPVAALLYITEVAVLLAAPVRAAAAVGRVRTVPEAEVRDDRDGLRLGRRRCSSSSTTSSRRSRKRRDRRAALHRRAHAAHDVGDRVLPRRTARSV